MKFDSTQSDQFDPSRTHKPHELDDERLIQDGFSKLPEPTPPTTIEPLMQEMCDCGHVMHWHSLTSDRFTPSAKGCLAYECACTKFRVVEPTPPTETQDRGFMCSCCGHKNFKNGSALCDFCFLGRIKDSKHQCKPVAAPTERVETTTEELCEEHGFRNCSVCGAGLVASTADGFREWLDANSSGMEGEDDTESLMHVAWRAALDAAVAPSPAPAIQDLYFIQDTRNYVGNSVMWWRPNGDGYTSDIDQAWKVTKEKAEQMHQNRPTDVPWPCTPIEAKAQRNFDMQLLRDIPKAGKQ